MTNEMLELAESGLRHAEGLTTQLAKLDWQPRRSHVEQARNSIQKLATILRAQSAALAPQGEPVAWHYRHSSTFRWTYTDEKPKGPSIHLFEVEPLYAAPAPQTQDIDRLASIWQESPGIRLNVRSEYPELARAIDLLLGNDVDE